MRPSSASGQWTFKPTCPLVAVVRLELFRIPLLLFYRPSPLLFACRPYPVDIQLRAASEDRCLFPDEDRRSVQLGQNWCKDGQRV